MKTKYTYLIAAVGAFAIPLLLYAAIPITQTRPLKIDNTRDEVKLTIQAPGTHTSNVVEYYGGSTLKFALPGTGIVPTAYGGTGSATTNGAFAALSPLTTRGDLLTRNATVNTRLAVGSANRLLRSDGTDPSWAQAVLTTDVTGVLPIANGGTGGATAAAALTALGVQAWSATTADDGTVTNTFATAYSVAPKVVITKVASASPTNSIAAPTTTNVVITIGEPSIVVHGISIGTP